MLLDLGRRALAAAALIGMPLAPSALAPTLGASGISPPTTVEYGPLPDQVADLYLPSNVAAPVPTVVLVHGGFWQAPYRRDLMEPTARDLCASGVAVLNLEYRRCGAGGGGGGFPSTLADVAHGIDWLASDAARETYGLDASRVALVGHSAGAQLVLWAAQRESLPRRAGGAGGDDELDPTAAGEADALRAALTEGGRAGPRAVRPRCVVSVGGCIDLGFARTDARQQRRATPDPNPTPNPNPTLTPNPTPNPNPNPDPDPDPNPNHNPDPDPNPSQARSSRRGVVPARRGGSSGRGRAGGAPGDGVPA